MGVTRHDEAMIYTVAGHRIDWLGKIRPQFFDNRVWYVRPNNVSCLTCNLALLPLCLALREAYRLWQPRFLSDEVFVLVREHRSTCTHTTKPVRTPRCRKKKKHVCAADNSKNRIRIEIRSRHDSSHESWNESRVSAKLSKCLHAIETHPTENKCTLVADQDSDSNWVLPCCNFKWGLFSTRCATECQTR